MQQPGAIGYVVINYDGNIGSLYISHILGIPVKHFPEDKIPATVAVQYAALIADLVIKTKHTLKQLNQGDQDFVYLRMRTKQDTEMIVTDYITPGSGNEYILVCIQSCKFSKDEEEEGEKAAN